MELISVCICTYKRPAFLNRLLISLLNQHISSGFGYELIVVDNDREASARTVVQAFMDQTDTKVTYAVEEQKSISLARNKCVALARGDYIAFIDDDERAESAWLDNLYTAMQHSGADAVFGPVFPEYPAHCPSWIIKGKFFERPQEKDGKLITYGRTGNALVKARWLRMDALPFDPCFGITGGEDSDFFRRIRQRGARFHWSQKGRVFEYVADERQNLRWLLVTGTGNYGGGTGLYTLGVGSFNTLGSWGPGHGPDTRLATRQPKKVRNVIPGTLTFRGSLDKEIIRRVVRLHMNEVKYCYDQELVRNRGVEGRVSVQFIISGTGQVITSFVQSTSMNNPRVESCVATAVKRWTFPKPEKGGLAIVSYPFNFVAGQGG